MSARQSECAGVDARPRRRERQHRQRQRRERDSRDEQAAFAESGGQPADQSSLERHLDDPDEAEEVPDAADELRVVARADAALDEQRQRRFHHGEAEHEEEVHEHQQAQPPIAKAAGEQRDAGEPRTRVRSPALARERLREEERRRGQVQGRERRGSEAGQRVGIFLEKCQADHGGKIREHAAERRSEDEP